MSELTHVDRRRQRYALLGALLVGSALFAAPEALAGIDQGGNTTVAPQRIKNPYAGHTVVQTTPTPIVSDKSETSLACYNYGTSPVCCTWTYADAGALQLADGGAFPGPTLGGPAPCIGDVQASGTSTAVPGTAYYDIAFGLTVSCVTAVAQSTDGGDLRCNHR